ncbi:MAG: hypothetical protein U9Q66_00545 [Patescibacteria group bacterium]|nr:hypothetical protein [Patescibacteria group bacterium]
MKYLIFILISLSLFSCSKSNTEPTVKELDIDKEYKKEIKLLTVNPIIDKNNIEDSEKIIEFSKIKVNNNETIIENENIFKNSTGTLEVETIIKNDNIAKSKFELINEEEYLLLTFSNIKECDKLVYIKNKCLDNFTFKLAEQSNKL